MSNNFCHPVKVARLGLTNSSRRLIKLKDHGEVLLILKKISLNFISGVNIIA